ncbi:MAG TPA: NAD+ synthase [Nitrososphaera sp.]
MAKASKRIERFVANYLATSGAKGLVVGLSGGLDSAVALQLCVRAVGARKVLGLIIPAESTPASDIRDAKSHADQLSVRHKTVDINPLVKSYGKLLPRATSKIKGNLVARIRMGVLYYHAALDGYLVVGTSDKSELLAGYYTKYGDGASDLMPLANLYKTQVREMAEYLGVPEKIRQKKSSPRLWPGQLAEKELGMDYETIDPILHCLVDKKMKPQQAAKSLAVPLKDVRKVQAMVRKSAHKRALPPAAT